MAKATTKSATNGSIGKNRITEPQATRVQIQPLNTQKLPFTLTGTSPLVMHAFDADTRKGMLEKQTGKKTKTSRELRCPVDEFLRSMYWVKGSAPEGSMVDGVLVQDQKEVDKAIADATFGFPLTAFKQAMIAACRNADIPMTVARQSFFVMSKYDPEFALIKGKPAMACHMVRLKKGGAPMERFRGMFETWSTEIVVDFDRNNFSPDQIANLLNIAGHYVGIGEGRPEKSANGWGRFTIVK